MTQAIQRSLHTFLHCVHRLVFGMIWVVLMFGIGFNQTANAAMIDATVEPFSVDSILGYGLTVRDNPDYDKLPKTAEFKQLPIYTESDVLTYNLPALGPVKRPPADKKGKLTPEEERFCLLARNSYVEDATAILPACEEITKFTLEEFNRQVPYSTVMRALNIARFNHNLDVSWQDYFEINDVASIYEAFQIWFIASQIKSHQIAAKKQQNKEFDIEDGLFCMDLSFLHRNLVDLAAMGYPLDRANNTAKVFNGSCAGAKIPLHDLMKVARVDFDNDTFWNRISPVFSITILDSVQKWKPNTYLPPNEGTLKQQRPEIQEAQKLLKQLGFYEGKETGKVDEATTEAIKKFEYNLGLNKTGRLTYTNLLRMRLYTEGFDAKRF